jgi:hypothetical protein
MPSRHSGPPATRFKVVRASQGSARSLRYVTNRLTHFSQHRSRNPLLSASCPPQEADDGEDEKYEKQYFCDAGCPGCQPTESQYGCNDRNDEENDGVMKHLHTSSRAMSECHQQHGTRKPLSKQVIRQANRSYVSWSRQVCGCRHAVESGAVLARVVGRRLH